MQWTLLSRSIGTCCCNWYVKHPKISWVSRLMKTMFLFIISAKAIWLPTQIATETHSDSSSNSAGLNSYRFRWISWRSPLKNEKNLEKCQRKILLINYRSNLSRNELLRLPAIGCCHAGLLRWPLEMWRVPCSSWFYHTRTASHLSKNLQSFQRNALSSATNSMNNILEVADLFTIYRVTGPNRWVKQTTQIAWWP